MNPYEILEISPEASDPQVRNAYVAAAKKYHPDNYAGTKFAEIAAEKMKQVNAAYDQIKAERGEDYNENPHTAKPRGSALLQRIQQLLSAGQLDQADKELDDVPPISRDAEWHFCKGNVCYARGWLEDATRFFTEAHTKDPHNAQYAAATAQVNNARRYGKGGRGYGGGYGGYNDYGGGGCSGCEICQGLLCADCCCECMGGDLIPCC